MSSHISYSDIVLLAELTSRSLLCLRNASGEDNGLAPKVSNLLTAQRQLQERAADRGDLVNKHSIRQDRASIVGGCWKIVNDLDIALERPSELSKAGIQKNTYDYTLAIYLLLATTSPKAHVESEHDLETGLRRTVNDLVPALIARAISEGRGPCSYVKTSKYVLEELKATMPDIGTRRHTERIKAYMDKLIRTNTEKATASINDATQHRGPPKASRGGLSFTLDDAWNVYDKFMKEEGEASKVYEEDDFPSTSQEETSPSDPEPDKPTAEKARGELHRIYETLRDYQGKYEDFVDKTPRNRKDRETQFQTLKEQLEQNVIEELEAVLLGENQQLHLFKKYIRLRTQEMVANVVKARNKVLKGRK
ncbi:MAG: hypothetical protein Q9225_003575 [Loekoesia sp. 1 TL-2023]